MMRRVSSLLFFLNILMINTLHADVFDVQYQQDTLADAITKDHRLSYDRNSADLNIDSPDIRQIKITEDSVSSGLKQFDLKKTLTGQIDNPDLNATEFNDFINKVGNSRLMTMQYTAPAQMDLYKFYVTNANLRLLLRYMQYIDLEHQTNDPIAALRKQAELDCLRHQTGSLNIDQAFKNCVNRAGAVEDNVFEKLNNPSNGRGYLTGKVNLIEASLTRSKNQHDSWDVVKDILPIYEVGINQISYVPPKRNARQYFMYQRKLILGSLDNAVSEYLQDHQITTDVVGFTERHIRQLCILNSHERYIAMTKLASAQAYDVINTTYLAAIDWLARAINQPQIEGGVKIYLRRAKEEVENGFKLLMQQDEINNLRHNRVVQVLEQVDYEKGELINK